MFSVVLETQASEKDPFESVNRITFTFNDYIDRYFFKPVAKGYKKVAPDFVEVGMLNFFDNLGEPLNILHGVLQGKLADAGNDSLRLVVNSTVGILGFIDIGSRIGLEKHDEDLGQTLGAWGVESGPYLMLPFFGPSTVRDAFAKIPDNYLSARNQWVDHERTRWELFFADAIVTRADLLDKEQLMAGDRYSFIRDAYLQNREFKVKDGETDASSLDDDFDDEFLFDEE
ncbi:MAG: VacJ family lipoprotein [Pseudomonadales bacterium]|nr:VacJ family lipoprotein [Pseudomonadales bacterium]